MLVRHSDHIRALVCGFPRRIRQGRHLVVLKADTLIGHADDSGSSDKIAYVLAGWISTVDEWESFSDSWETICNRHPKMNFHMNKVRNKSSKRVHELSSLICAKAKYRVDAVMSRQNYDTFVKDKLPAQIDDPYFMLFYNVITASCRLMDRLNLDGTVDWIFDDQGKIGTEAVAWYDLIKARAAPEVTCRLGSTPIFRHDDDVLPIKAADMLAWQIRRHIVEEQPNGVAHNGILESFLAKHGVSCNMTGPDLVKMVDEIVSGKGILIQSQCQFLLPPDINTE